MAQNVPAVINVPSIGEVKFGKAEKVVALPLPDGARGWRYVSRDAEVFDAPMSDFSAEIKEALAEHGQKQKEKDKVAGSDSAAEMMQGIRNMHQQLASGIFNAQGGGGGFGDNLLAEALAEVTQQDLDACKKFVRGLSANERLALRNDEASGIKAKVAELEAKRAATVTADPKAILARLGVNIVG